MERLRLRVSYGGQTADLSTAQSLTYSNAIPGGFSQCSFVVPGTLAQISQITCLQYLADVTIFDEGANVVWEGYLADIDYTIGYGQDGVQITCVGHQEHLSNPAARMYLKRELADYIQRPYADGPAFIRPDLIKMDIGQITASTAIIAGFGVGLTATQGTVLAVSHQNGPLYTHPFHDDSLNYISRLKFDVTIAGNPAGGVAGNCQLQVYGYSRATGTYSAAVYTNSTNGTSSASIDFSGVPSNRSGFLMLLVNITAGAPATSITALVSNIRIIGPRVGSTDEPVYGYEAIRELVSFASNYGLSAAVDQVDADTSYQFDELDFLTTGPVSYRDAYNYITGFYDRYWAVWENKQTFWKPTTARAPDWTIPNSTGVKMRLQPSMSQSANNLFLKYSDSAGKPHLGGLADSDPNNIVTRAGKTRYVTVDLGTVSNGSPLQQIANIAFPQLRYEVMKGTLQIPAMAELRGSTGVTLPAYMLRAGSVVRAPGAGRPRDLFSSNYDRRTLFIVRQVDVDWDGQLVTVTIDNNTDRLSTYLARVQSTIGARFGGVL